MNLRLDRPLKAKPHRDWRVTIVLALTCVVVAMLAVGTPAVIASSNTTSQLNRAAALTGCRSQAGAKVTDKRTDLDLALANSASAQDAFLTAVGGPRDAAIYEVVFTRIATVQHALDMAAAALDRANATYQTSVRLSTSDPDRFLAACQDG